MATYNLRGTEGEVSDNLIEILDAETKKADDMATEIEALKAERDALLARMANMEAEEAEEREEEAGDMHGKKKDEDEDKNQWGTHLSSALRLRLSFRNASSSSTKAAPSCHRPTASPGSSQRNQSVRLAQ